MGRKFGFRWLLAGLMVSWIYAGTWANAEDKAAPASDFSFVQLSDTHWGFNDKTVNHSGMAGLQWLRNPQPLLDRKHVFLHDLFDRKAVLLHMTNPFFAT